MQLLETAALAATFALSLPAQAGFDLDKTTPGTAGAVFGLAVHGAPANALALMMLSLTGGPLPLALVDPGDPRSLSVGVESTAAWRILLTDANGGATQTLALPNIAAVAGLRLHWQAATLPGSTHLVDRLSNDVVSQFGAAGLSRMLPASLLTARAFAVQCPDRSNNGGLGDVMIAGGGTGTGLTSATGLASSELWDFRHLTLLPGPNMSTARALHVAVELSDGRTLVVGGVDASGTVLASCEIYDPGTNSFAAAASMATGRTMHSACRLADGRVLVTGGTSSLADTTAAITGVLSSVELYNPTTNTWSSGPAIGGRRLAPALTRLPNNNIMVSGGVQVGFLFGIPISAVSTTAVQFYNPTSNSWSNGPAMRQGRAGHHYNQVTLANGRVLLTGGINVPDLLNAANASSIQNAEYYDPASNSWTAVNMPTVRSLHSATLLPDGTVVVCGGGQGTLTAPVSIDNVERFDPATNTWTALAPLATARASHAAVLQPDGLLVLIGGMSTTASLGTVEVLHF